MEASSGLLLALPRPVSYYLPSFTSLLMRDTTPHPQPRIHLHGPDRKQVALSKPVQSKVNDCGCASAIHLIAALDVPPQTWLCGRLASQVYGRPNRPLVDVTPGLSKRRIHPGYCRPTSTVVQIEGARFRDKHAGDIECSLIRISSPGQLHHYLTVLGSTVKSSPTVGVAPTEHPQIGDRSHEWAGRQLRGSFSYRVIMATTTKNPPPSCTMGIILQRRQFHDCVIYSAPATNNEPSKPHDCRSVHMDQTPSTIGEGSH